MAAGAFGIIGVLFLLCAWRPKKYANIIPILAIMNLFEGILLLVYGLILEIALFPFIVDVAIGIVPGAGILLLRESLKN